MLHVNFDVIAWWMNNYMCGVYCVTADVKVMPKGHYEQISKLQWRPLFYNINKKTMCLIESEVAVPCVDTGVEKGAFLKLSVIVLRKRSLGRTEMPVVRPSVGPSLRPTCERDILRTT